MRLQFAEDLGVIAGVDDDHNIVVILGAGADHRRAADVDIFDAIGERRTPLYRRLERIKIDHEEIDRRDAMRQHHCLVFGVFPDCQKPAMNFWMQGFDPPIQELRKAGQIGDFAGRKPSFGKCGARAAG